MGYRALRVVVAGEYCVIALCTASSLRLLAAGNLSSMDRCPPEIHERIFSYACRSDPTTGCSLSLISHYIREVSAPYHWQSIALAGFQRVVQLASQIRHIKGKKPIYHLFLCDRPPSSQHCVLHPDDYSAYDSDFLPALCTVLAYACATLETLSFFSDASFFQGAIAVRHLCSFPYPHLKELTLRACCTPRQLAGSQPRDMLLCQTPVLEKLHLALPYHGFSNDNLQATHNLVQSISPDVTHLRFTLLDKWGNRRVVEVIHAELAASGIVAPVLDLPSSQLPGGASTAVAFPVTWDRLLPPNLSFFAMQPSPNDAFYCSCCMDLRGDMDVIRILERMSEKADHTRFGYMRRRSVSPRSCSSNPIEVAGYGYVEAKQDWMERIYEGDGCWKQKEVPDLDVDLTVDQRPQRPPSVDTTRKSASRASRLFRLANAVRRLRTLWQT